MTKLKLGMIISIIISIIFIIIISILEKNTQTDIKERNLEKKEILKNSSLLKYADFEITLENNADNLSVCSNKFKTFVLKRKHILIKCSNGKSDLVLDNILRVKKEKRLVIINELKKDTYILVDRNKINNPEVKVLIN